jgi:hypothetical protein
MVHLSASGRPEVVLFGRPPTFRGPFSLLAGEFAVTSSGEGVTATVSYVSRHGRTFRKTCGLEAEELIRCMADMGATYPEVVALLMQASSCNAVDCPVRVDALPNPVPAEDLVDLGRGDPSGNALLPAGSSAPPAAPAGGGGR